jgi:hypothetical protein
LQFEEIEETIPVSSWEKVMSPVVRTPLWALTRKQKTGKRKKLQFRL